MVFFDGDEIQAVMDADGLACKPKGTRAAAQNVKS
jgi:hypothetical protein